MSSPDTVLIVAQIGMIDRAKRVLRIALKIRQSDRRQLQEFTWVAAPGQKSYFLAHA